MAMENVMPDQPTKISIEDALLTLECAARKSGHTEFVLSFMRLPEWPFVAGDTYVAVMLSSANQHAIRGLTCVFPDLDENEWAVLSNRLKEYKAEFVEHFNTQNDNTLDHRRECIRAVISTDSYAVIVF